MNKSAEALFWVFVWYGFKTPFLIFDTKSAKIRLFEQIFRFSKLEKSTDDQALERERHMVYGFCSKRLHLHRINSFVKIRSNLVSMWRFWISLISKFEASMNHPGIRCPSARKGFSHAWTYPSDLQAHLKSDWDTGASISFEKIRKFIFLLQKDDYFRQWLAIFRRTQDLPTLKIILGLNFIVSGLFVPFILVCRKKFWIWTSSSDRTADLKIFMILAILWEIGSNRLLKVLVQRSQNCDNGTSQNGPLGSRPRLKFCLWTSVATKCWRVSF